jgi:hypothetical protein
MFFINLKNLGCFRGYVSGGDGVAYFSACRWKKEPEFGLYLQRGLIFIRLCNNTLLNNLLDVRGRKHIGAGGLKKELA